MELNDCHGPSSFSISSLALGPEWLHWSYWSYCSIKVYTCFSLVLCAHSCEGEKVACVPKPTLRCIWLIFMKHHWRMGCKRRSKDCRLEDGPCSFEHIITILSCQTFITLSFSFLFTVCRSNSKLVLLLVMCQCKLNVGLWWDADDPGFPGLASTQYLHLRTILIRLWSLKCVS